jgi:CubicO group peptidase (beta-lactamase class C family)
MWLRIRALSRKRLIIVATLFLVVAPSRADELDARLDKFVAAAGVNVETPGVGIAIIEKGKVSFSKGYGLARLRDKTPFTPATTCEIASMTKMFTAAAVMVLHDQGKLNLQDDVRKYVPELPEYFPGKPVAITHLLQHTSGLPDYLRFPEPKGKASGFVTNEDYAGLFARLKDKFPALAGPGAKFQYNNSNYMLLALIVERVSKQSFDEYLKAAVLQPLGMKQSWVYESWKSAVKSAPNAIAYRKQKTEWVEGWGCPPFRDESLLTVGDGGLWTSLDDLVKWDVAKVLKPETMKLALSPSKTADGKTNTYGFGMTLTFNGDKLVGVGHGGAWVFQTLYHRDLKHDRTVIILSNREDMNVNRLREKIGAVLKE